jgi:hypothetical protein
MTQSGDPIILTGTLIRDDAGFALRVERGVVYHLELRRTPVDHVEKRVHVTGRLIGDHRIEAEGVVLA